MFRLPGQLQVRRDKVQAVPEGHSGKTEEVKVNANEAKVNAAAQNSPDNGRRAFIGTSALALGALTVKAQERRWTAVSLPSSANRLLSVRFR